MYGIRDVFIHWVEICSLLSQANKEQRIGSCIVVVGDGDSRTSSS